MYIYKYIHLIRRLIVCFVPSLPSLKKTQGLSFDVCFHLLSVVTKDRNHPDGINKVVVGRIAANRKEEVEEEEVGDKEDGQDSSNRAVGRVMDKDRTASVVTINKVMGMGIGTNSIIISIGIRSSQVGRQLQLVAKL